MKIYRSSSREKTPPNTQLAQAEAEAEAATLRDEAEALKLDLEMAREAALKRDDDSSSVSAGDSVEGSSSASGSRKRGHKSSSSSSSSSAREASDGGLQAAELDQLRRLLRQKTEAFDDLDMRKTREIADLTSQLADVKEEMKLGLESTDDSGAVVGIVSTWRSGPSGPPGASASSSM